MSLPNFVPVILSSAMALRLILRGPGAGLQSCDPLERAGGVGGLDLWVGTLIEDPQHLGHRLMIVIHIGLKKSGSSSIQTFLAGNEDALRAMGVDYTPIGRLQRKAHHNLASEAMVRKKFKAKRGTLGELASQTASSQYPITLISSEMFEGCEDYAVDHVREAFEPAGQQIRIVLVIRELIDLITSRYAQKIRYGYNTYDFDTFVESKLNELRVNYFETASRWAEVFGWDNISVRPLDSTQLLNGDLIDDFLNTIGVDLAHPLMQTLKRPGVVNAASGWKTLEAIRALHTKRHGLEPLHPLAIHAAQSDPGSGGKMIESAAQEAGELLGWSRDKSRYLTLPQAQRTMEIYAEAVSALNTRLTNKLPRPRGLAERGFVEREFMPDVAHIPANELRTFYEGVSARFFGRREGAGDSYSSSLSIEDPDGEKPAMLLQPTPGSTSQPTLVIETRDFYKREDQSEIAARFCDDNGIDEVDVHFAPPGFLSRGGSKRAVKFGSVKHWAIFGKNAEDDAESAKRLKDPVLKIVSLADGRTTSGVTQKCLLELSNRLGTPVSFEPICLPPTPVLLSDAVFLDYFRSRSRDVRSFDRVLAVRDKLRAADLIVMDDISELQWPMMRSYPVLSHKLERTADADLLAYRSDVYTELHDRLPIAVVNGSNLAMDVRDVVIDAFSRVIRTPVFRMAAARALAEFTLDWEYRPMVTGVGGPGQGEVDPGDFISALGDWIESRMAEGLIRRVAGDPAAEMIGQIDLRPFDCMAADQESLSKVLDAYNRFCITGPASSVAFIRKYLAAAGKTFVRAEAHRPRFLASAEPFDCLLCCGSFGPVDTQKPTVAVMSAGWPAAGLNLPEALSDIPPRGRVPTCAPAHWYSPVLKRDSMTGGEQSAYLEIARLTREQRERFFAPGGGGYRGSKQTVAGS